MSGIEVAGLVLGALPLVISGLEHYAEGATTIKRMFRAPGEFRSLSRRLRVEQDIFRNAMELLLSDCVDDASLQELLDNVGGSSWSEPAVDSALRRKLNRSYKIYFETIEDLNKTLLGFRERLQLSDDGKGPFDSDSSSFREAFRRFRFGIKKADYMDLIEEISRDNSALLKLTEQSAALEPARTSRRSIPNFDKIRHHASSMFSTLQVSLRGSCKAPHRASLYIKPLETSKVGTLDEVHAFRVVLQHESKGSGTTPHLPTQWVVEETEIRMLDVLATGNTVSSTAGSTQTSKPAAGKGGKKSVSFQGTGSTTLPASGMLSASQQQQALIEIQDLCQSIQSLRTLGCGICLGYLHDQVNARRHGLYRPEKPLVDQRSLISVTLGSLLSGNASRQKSLSVADSRRLALALAIGVLRLHNTPWLGEQWNRDDITLFRQNNCVLAQHPFISTDLSTAAAAKQSPKASPAIRNDTLFALGIVLIELCMEQNFDSLHLPEDLNPDGTKHAASDFLAANRLVDQVYDRAGKRYGDAVRRCILCEFDQRKSSLEDAAFQKAVYDNVVSVLEEDVSQFFGL